MEKESISRFLNPKRLSFKDVHTELAQIFGSDAIAYSTVISEIGNDIILQNEPESQNREENQGFSITDNAILKGLKMVSFASIRQIAKMTFIPVITVFRRLTKSLHFALKRVHSVLHRFSNLRKQAPVIISQYLLKLLESMRYHSWSLRCKSIVL
jgi:hypothetical protein